MLSNYLAEIWGISIVVVALALLIKDKHLKSLFAKIETEESLFCWGLVSFVIGLAMVLSHNIWISGWQVIITILGWLSLLKGLALLFVPEYMKNWAKKLAVAPFLPYALVILVFVGLIITYFGFLS